MNPDRPRTRWTGLALGVALLFTVLGTNWAFFDRYGSDMPDWDQWDAEAVNLLAPWFERNHFIAHLFEPQNEHRVVLTKVQNLATVLASGQWDARLESFCNAFLHAGIAIGLWVFVRRWIEHRWHAPLFVLIALLYSLPLAWQNVLGGFHSQQYWLVGLSFTAIALLPFARTGRTAWWLGAVAAILVLGSMGSGFLAAAVVLALLAYRLFVRETRWRDAWPAGLLCLALVVVGDLTRVERDYHEHLKAKSAHDFVFSLLRSLEWPLRDCDWAGPIVWAPWLLLAFSAGRRWMRRSGNHRPVEGISRPEMTILALGGWVLIQLLATAYARGAGAGYPAPRYMDTLIFATMVNALALALCAQGARRTLRNAIAAVAVIWLAAIGWGSYKLCAGNLADDLPHAKTYYIGTESHLRAYLATEDIAELTEPIPYPEAKALTDRLAPPSIRALMPESVRPSLVVNGEGAGIFERDFATPRTADAHAKRGVAPDTPLLLSRASWGSFSKSARVGEWTSQPVRATLGGWLRFDVTGDFGAPGLTLELRDAANGATLATVAGRAPASGTWKPIYVRAPARPFMIHARDSSEEAWFAFSAPVEVSSPSFLAKWLMRRGAVLAVVAAVSGLALLASSMRPDPHGVPEPVA